MLKIATWNINSINARLPHLIKMLEEEIFDILCLQELKCDEDKFPKFEISTREYNSVFLGQKSYNGVAIISKKEIKVEEYNLPNFEDDNSRYIEAIIESENIRIASIYMPNGNPPYNNPNDTSKLEYKLKWMESFYKHCSKLVHNDERVLMLGDYNIIPTEKDVYNYKQFKDNALCNPKAKQRFRAIEHLGFYDAFKAKHPNKNDFTFWDYTNGAFNKNEGMRIDFAMLNPKAIDSLIKCEVYKEARSWSKPSDHTPLVIDID